MKLKNLENRQKKDIKKLFLHILIVAIVACVGGAAFKNFFESAGIIPTGLSGLAMIIKTGILHIGADIPTSIIYLIINVILFAFSIRIMGWRFIILTAVGMVFYTLGMEFLTIPQIYYAAEIDKLLYSVVGSMITGLTVGVAMKLGGSTGGSDIAAVIINRYFPKIKTGYCLLIINAIVLLLSVVVGGLQTGLYALICSVINAMATNLVLDGSKRVVAFYIICDKEEEIAESILQKYHRGVTRLDAKGMFSKKDKTVLLSLLPNDYSRDMKKLIHSIDPDAFVFSTPVTETIGDGTFMREMSIFKNKVKTASAGLKTFAKHSRHENIKKLKLSRKEKLFKLNHKK